MCATDDEYRAHSSHLTNSKFYGSSPSPDCPVEGEKPCLYVEKSGIVTSVQGKVHNSRGLDMHPVKEMHMPISSLFENGSWAGKAFFENLTLKDFTKGTDDNGNDINNQAIKIHEKSSDFITI
jgi:hypothetical protein